MARDKDILTRAKILERYKHHIANSIEMFYSALTIVLYNSGNSDEDITELVSAINRLMNDAFDNGDDICEVCERMTGFVYKEQK